ncbi:MAG TPA: T9SS type A sorting domain-containing protein [Saprospiraceae bacterium]|nr:T9SS type A sorting domain-containing protein [Saprospiraceae bacterium]
MRNRNFFLLFLFFILGIPFSFGKLINANPSNYTSYISGLLPDDTLLLAPGNYLNRLNLNNLAGNASSPIVIMGSGNTTVFLANACCNTVDMTNVAYLVLRDFKIDGQHINYVDGVKAGGGGNTFAHHITLENITIVNNGGNIEGDNQTVGISTKCAAWNWTIRGCTIIAAGTGIYLGNSDGTMPFVSGLIENNLVINTRGYNMQIKAQNDNVRQLFPGTATDSQTTIIRYNVWSKETGSTAIGQGDGARPCVLMDNFPSSGYGSHDHYEVYGNFFYQNPTEALIQVTGNTTMYSNIFVNHVAPAGFEPVVITNHNGFQPREMNFFHNTILTNSSEGGVGLYGANTNYQQYCYANAIFSNGTPVIGFKPANTVDNITDTYTNADHYVNDPSGSLSQLDLYPLSGQLQGTTTSDALFTRYTDYDIDFNADLYDGVFRGAYSGEDMNPGWKLQLDIRPTPLRDSITGIEEQSGSSDFVGMVYPNPAQDLFKMELHSDCNAFVNISLLNMMGETVRHIFKGEIRNGSNIIQAELDGLAGGFYLIRIEESGRILTKKILIQRP